MKIVHLDIYGPMKDIVFMEDSENICNNLEIRQCGKNEAPMVVGMDEFSNHLLFGLS